MLNIIPVAEHDSWIALDLVWGCMNNCGYCYLRKEDMVGIYPQERFIMDQDIQGQIESILEDSPQDIPVSIGNTTDILVNESFFRRFLKMAGWISRIDPGRAVVVITKAKITKAMANAIAEATDGNGIIVLSQSFSRDYDTKIEKGNVSCPEDTYRSMEIIAGTDGVKAIHFWRPFLSKWNSANDIERRVKRLSDSGCCGSVVIGLKGNQNLFEAYSEELKEWASVELQQENVLGDERILQDRLEVLLSVSRRYRYPVFRQTSCGMSFLEKWPDINGTSRSQIRETHCEKTSCPQNQRRICEKDSLFFMETNEIRKRIQRYANGINVVVDGQDISVSGQIDEFTYNHLVHVLHRKPKADGICMKKVWKGHLKEK